MHRTSIPLVALLLVACGDQPAAGESSAVPGEPPAVAAEQPPANPAQLGHEAHAEPSESYQGPGNEAPPVPQGARVFFESPKNGETVSGPLTDGKVDVDVKMGLEGMTLRNAGKVLEGSGHHHVIIDGAPLAGNLPVPADETHIHFGKSQTEATLQLAPGEHKLTLQFADGIHRSYGPGMSETIAIRVEAGEGGEANPGAVEK